MSENKNVSSNGMVKNVGVATAIFTVVGSIIGAGVFFKPQAIYTATGGAPGLGMLGWVIAGLITLCAGLTVSELAASIPKTGGMIVYIREIYGDRLGFLAGWVQVFLYFPGMISALAVIFADQFVSLTGMSYLKFPVVLIVITIITIFNLWGSKPVAYLGNVATICKVAVLIIIMIAGFVLGKGSNPVIHPFVAEGVNPVIAAGSVLLAIFFAFDGWINVCALAGEMKNPGRDLAKSIVWGLIGVMLIYLVINLAYLHVLPASDLAKTATPGLAVSIAIFGEMGGKILGMGIMISVFGAATAFSFTGSRVLYALAEEKILPKSDKLLELNSNKVPKYSILFMSIISALFALSGQFNLLSDLAIFSIWIFIVLTFFAVLKNRKLNDVSKFTYKVPLYPIVPIIAILGGAFVLVVQLINNTMISFGSIGILLLGLPIYQINKNKKKK